MSDTRPTRRGRPQNPELEETILHVTISLLEHTSFAGLSIETIAKQAGVGKPTVYRRWPTKAALVAEALARSGPEIRIAANGDLRTALRRGLVDFACTAVGSPMGHVLYSVLGEAIVDPALAETIRERYLAPRQRVINEALQRGVETGVLRSDLDISLMHNLLLGPALHSWANDGKSMTRRRAGQLFDAAWEAIAAR